MVFSSMVFLCIFLPAVFLLHLIVPGIRQKNALLLIASLIFYAYGEPVYVLLMLVSVFVNYLGACGIAGFSARKKSLLTLVILANLGLLAVFKYLSLILSALQAVTGLDISAPDIQMPIGISFFTFQAMSYVIDVYRERTEAQKNFFKVLLYISFFPQLVAGPIVKYHDIAREIDGRRVELDECSSGLRRFAAGLCKKVLIANTMGAAADAIFDAAGAGVGCAGAWLAAVSYMLQIYFDFSGYSDMAIGMGAMFGFHFKENFEHPYISVNIRDFWRRWHISLSGWFKEYLYIPLGGNRKGKFRTLLNKMIVFLCTGIWHGAAVNFIFWGIYHGFFLILEECVPWIGRKGGKLKAFFQHAYTLLVVCVGFVFFRADTMSQGLFMVKRMFTGGGNTRAAMNLVLSQLTPVYLVTFLAAVIASAPVLSLVNKRRGWEPAAYMFSIAGLLLCILSLAGGTYNPFIYFRF